VNELAIQKTKRCDHCGSTMRSFSQEDEERWQEYKDNQIINAKTTGAKKPRSYQQLKLYWVCCGKVSENHNTWSTKEVVDFNLRVALDFRDPQKVAVRPDGQVQFFYRSIAFKNLPHMEACNYFDRAFDLMAKSIGVTADELIGESV